MCQKCRAHLMYYEKRVFKEFILNSCVGCIKFLPTRVTPRRSCSSLFILNKKNSKHAVSQKIKNFRFTKSLWWLVFYITRMFINIVYGRQLSCIFSNIKLDFFFVSQRHHIFWKFIFIFFRALLVWFFFFISLIIDKNVCNNRMFYVSVWLSFRLSHILRILQL